MTHDMLQDMLEALSDSPDLSVSDALTHTRKIVERFGGTAVALEEKGRLAEALALYEGLADAFQRAAQKVPEEASQRVASLGDYWSLRAMRVRIALESTIEPAPSPLPQGKRRGDRITDRLSRKKQQEGLVSSRREFKPPTGPLGKLGEMPSERRAGFTVSSLSDERGLLRRASGAQGEYPRRDQTRWHTLISPGSPRTSMESDGQSRRRRATLSQPSEQVGTDDDE